MTKEEDFSSSRGGSNLLSRLVGSASGLAGFS